MKFVSWCAALCLLIVAGPLLSAETVLDDFSAPGEIQWGIWQSSKPYTYKTEKKDGEGRDGKGVLYLDMRNGSGMVQRRLPADEMKKATGVTITLKAAPGNVQKKLEVLFSEKEGHETYYTTIDIPSDWKELRIDFDALKLFPHGGSKIVDGKLDVADLSAMKLSGYGGGRVLLLDSVKLVNGNAVTEKQPEENREVVFQDVSLEDGPRRSRGAYPECVSNVKISGNQFVRGEKPVYLLGGWQLDNECHPWLLSLLDFDVYVYNATEIYLRYAPQRKGNVIEVKVADVPWYERWLRGRWKSFLPRFAGCNPIFPPVEGRCS